ncbi:MULTISPECIES: MFS transporter [unclassified Rhodococcus (in: high G+C Gram-positive bacteria)]|uniref:MFS transporter n=1 Tax=unclassified Rhodococcus (in: high G+C Gram-positive bacteria) TaxID=192944 RepID=UPI0024B8130A|nr:MULTISPECIES: MFS transporter [unclassified Rhodococcus (in: high G+C Gram-positive bacteria)]MDI9958884.1 MFS transporter [Rhodococcus sp. IEGM 1237]MDI9964529.1 MFS transporter [Rhodococcus sp. IEGM 1251]MDV8126855.1 MFS transporter [Rhodococcus sp. IEGM 1304]
MKDRLLALHSSPTTRRSSRLITAILCLSGTVVALQQTMVIPLLPDFPKILGVSADDASWLVTVTLLTSAVATPIVSRLADMFGKRRMMLISMTMIVVGSLVAAIGGNFVALLIGRGLQGFAISMIPVGISIMRDELPKEKVASATALMSATLGIGSALGLPLSGLIFEHLGWPAIFWLSAIVGVLLIIAVAVVVPESSVRTRGKFDFLGAVMLSTALTAILLAISKGARWGWTSELTLLMFVIGIVTLALWFPYELRVTQPMVDLRTSAKRPVLLTNVASILVGFSMYANNLSTTQQLQMPKISGYGFELGVMAAGLCMIPAGLAMVFFAPVSANITKRFGAKITLIVGGTVLALAYIARVFLTGSIALIIISAAVVSIGTAIAYSAMPMLIMRSVPITETASANGLNSLLRSVGTSTSSAVVAAMLTSMVIPSGPGEGLPSIDAFKNIFWLAAIAAVAAAAAAAFIPRRGAKPEAALRPVTPEGFELPDAAVSETEIVVAGRVVRADSRPIRQAVVTVMDMEGRPIDWSRADNEGNFSLALPRPGRYLVVTSADGWSPRSQVISFDSAQSTHTVELGDRLTISGKVGVGGRTTSGTVVTLTKPTGEFVASTVTDGTGHHGIALPTSGRYILTALTESGHGTLARQIAVIAQSTVVDFDVPVDAEPLTTV